jgi:hypothetical protein
MKEITNPTWIKAKGILFLLVGILAATLLVLEHPTWKVALLLALAIWCSCRFYYFAFYVIEKYIDADYKFSGLWSLIGYLIQNRQKK